MKRGTSHHVASYEGDRSSAGSNPETVLAGVSSFDISDVEVLYKAHGGMFLHGPYKTPNRSCNMDVLLNARSSQTKKKRIMLSLH